MLRKRFPKSAMAMVTAILLILGGLLIPAAAATATTITCVSAPANCSYPSAASTGPYASMTAASGNYTVSVQWSHLQNWDIAGCLTIDGDDITVSNVRIHGSCGYGIWITAGSERITIKDVIVDCNNTTGTGIAYHDVTIIRTEIYGCENGVDVQAPGHVTIRDSYIHDLTTGGSTHSDGVQVGAGVDQLTIEHNTMIGDSTWNTVIILFNAIGAGGGVLDTNVWINHNLLSGAGYVLDCQTGSPVSNNVIYNNRFGPSTSGPVSWCTISGGHITGWAGNIYDADESPVSQF